MQIQFHKVALQFNGKAPLFRDVDLTVGDRDFVIIEGPSGCGKSSLLRLINRLHEPSEGKLTFDGKEADEWQVTQLRRRIALLQQTPVLVGGSVRENLLLPFVFRASEEEPPGDDQLRERLDHLLLESVELDEEAATLSVGQKQRIALLRLLLLQPEVFLCDEPTSALDDRSREVVEMTLEGVHADDGRSVVLVTHQPFHPQRVAPRVYRFTDDGWLEEKEGS